MVLALGGATVQAQTADAASSNPPTLSGWQACAELSADAARLACFDGWARQQRAATPTVDHAAPPVTAPASATPTVPAEPATPPVVINVSTAPVTDCTSRAYSTLSRFWELESGTDCDTFGLRGYRPISLSLIGSNSVNRQPGTPSPGHTPASGTPYRQTETRIGLSVRTKIAQGLLTRNDPVRRDSVWFAYSQQSYWQLFSGAISRPFRNTDHEPEFIYVYPVDTKLPGAWRWRYAGTGIVHQSNGQSLPLSRSWNRVYLMAGLELGNRFTVQARAWKRLPEHATDDDNPDISDYVGRAELTGSWDVNPVNTLGVTLRHAMRATGRGSVRLEWLRTLGSRPAATHDSGLRLHTQLFSGYGDSLVDYNRRRTVLSMGLSLVDF